MYLPLGSKVDSDKLSEPRRVVVLDCFGVSEGLKDGVTSDKLLIQIASVSALTFHAANRGKVLNNCWGRLVRFTGQLYTGQITGHPGVRGW